MNTEITETRKGWVVYDAECRICRNWAARSYRVLRRRGFGLVPFHVAWVRKELGLKDGQLPDEMRLLTPDGKNPGGADAIIEIMRSIWWALPVVLLARIPGVMEVLRAAYRFLARRRYCINGTCKVPNAGAHHTPEHSVTSGFYEIP